MFKSNARFTFYTDRFFYDMETFIKQSSRLQKLGGDPRKLHLESPLHTMDDKKELKFWWCT